jgi:DNA-binding NarL/FixJ family response regulator
MMSENITSKLNTLPRITHTQLAQIIFPELTQHEAEIAVLYATVAQAKSVARYFDLSLSAIEKVVSKIYDKLEDASCLPFRNKAALSFLYHQRHEELMFSILLAGIGVRDSE